MWRPNAKWKMSGQIHHQAGRGWHAGKGRLAALRDEPVTVDLTLCRQMVTLPSGKILDLSPWKRARYSTMPWLIVLKSFTLRFRKSVSSSRRPAMYCCFCASSKFPVPPSWSRIWSSVVAARQTRRWLTSQYTTMSVVRHSPATRIVSKCWNSHLSPRGHGLPASWSGHTSLRASILLLYVRDRSPPATVCPNPGWNRYEWKYCNGVSYGTKVERAADGDELKASGLA